MNWNTLKIIILTGTGGTCSFIINDLLGGWTEDLATLLIFMGIDFVMGLMIASVWQRSGKSGWSWRIPGCGTAGSSGIPCI